MKKTLILLPLLFVAGFGSRAAAAVPQNLTGAIKIDGSSTVYPITEAVAEEFGKTSSGVKVTVGISGTGGGFKKFVAGELDIVDASRPIKAAEHEAATKAGINFIEIPIAYDALTVVVNPKNTWAKSMTIADLKKMWEPEAQGKIMTWNQVRPDWPNQPIKLFGPGVDSGTYDYFTESVVGKQGASRGDYTSSEDDNVLVQGVSKDPNALGYFGLAYYESNTSKLQAVAIDDGNAANGAGPILPSKSTVLGGTYQPLARPLFIYVRKEAAERPEIQAFVNYYLKNGTSLINEVGYVPLSEKVQAMAFERFEKRTMGTLFAAAGGQSGVTLEKLLSAPAGTSQG